MCPCEENTQRKDTATGMTLSESVGWWNHIFINFYLYRKKNSHQIMQSRIALQIKTQYKTNILYFTINMEPQK